MENIDINNIRKKGFEKDSEEEKVEKYCRTVASEYTDKLIKLYNELEESRNGNYINSDLMKMVFPFYAKSLENRKKFNLSITNSAAVLTNEAYMRALQRPDVQRCIYVVGPYGAGKSFFAQSLFEREGHGLLKNAIVYEGSITPPAFAEKVRHAIDNNVTPSIIALNPTLELSIRNIKKRAKEIGRDVEKDEVIDKFSNMYRYLKDLLEQFSDIAYVIYNKKQNIAIDLNSGSINLEDLNQGSIDEISKEYDRIIKILNREKLQMKSIHCKPSKKKDERQSMEIDI